jgi:hypothetical protein
MGVVSTVMLDWWLTGEESVFLVMSEKMTAGICACSFFASRAELLHLDIRHRRPRGFIF